MILIVELLLLLLLNELLLFLTTELLWLLFDEEIFNSFKLDVEAKGGIPIAVEDEMWLS